MAVYLCIASNDVPPIVSKRVALNVNCKNNIKLFFQIYIKKHVFFYLKKSCPTSDDYDQSNRTFRFVGYRNPSDLSNRISSAQYQSLDETRSWQWYQGHLTQVIAISFCDFNSFLKTFQLFSAKYKMEDENRSRPSNYKTNTTLTIHDIRPEDIRCSCS